MMEFLTFISNRLRAFFSGESPKQDDNDPDLVVGKEKALAFSFAIFFALCLWVIVNMSRDFNVTIDVPIELTNIPANEAVSSDIPEYASINLTGEGWKLISLYNNPPTVSLDAESRQVNLFEQIRNQVNSFSDMNIIQVDPLILTVETEEKTSKKVPVVAQMDIRFRDQFGVLQDPVLEPDSVTVTGAQSVLNELYAWETAELTLDNVNRSLERSVDLAAPEGGLIVEPSSVTLRLEVAEFTEAEVRIPVRTRNLPPGKAVTYNPSSITVKFDVPIEQYSEVQGTRPFAAFVDYSTLESDTTGLVTPEIEEISSGLDVQVRLKNFQPSRVSYFNILPD